MPDKIPSVPDGYLAVTPWVILDGVADFLSFLGKVFDAEEVIRMTAPDGLRITHAEARINGGPVMMFDRDDSWPVTPAFLRVYVDDCDGTVQRAEAAGSVVVTPPTTLWIGDRIARIRDPWDNLWWVHTRVAAPSEEELEAGPPDEEAREAIQMVGDTLDAEMRRRGAAAADG